MPLAVPNVTTAALPAQTAAPAARQTTTTNTSDPFETILARASSDARAPEAARDASNAAAGAEEAAQLEQERVEGDELATDEAAADAVAAQLAAQLATAQLVAPQNLPLPTDLTPALPTGQLASDAQNLTAPEVNANQFAPPTQSNPLFRQAGAEAGPQNNTRLPGSVTQTTPPADATTPPLVPAPPAQNPTPTPAPAAQAPATTGLAAAVAAVRPGQQQVVPAQAPIVAGLLPNPTDAGATALPTPVTAPQAPIEAAALPNVTVGDRPGTAGEQFAAIASAASTLTPAVVPPTAEFAQTLTNATVSAATISTAAPAPLAAPDDRIRNPEGADASQPTALPPTFSPAPPANAVSNAQTPTAVRSPDPAVQVADGIVTHAQMVARGGETEFRMRLDPPELGAVKVRLVADGDGIRGQVVVSNDAIRRMIESQLPELRQRLEQAGVAVGHFDVSTDPNPGSGADTGGWGGYRSEFPADAVRAPAPPALRAARGRTAGAVDVMA